MAQKLHLFKNTRGKIVLMQWPNIPLAGWIVTRLLTEIINNQSVSQGLSNLSQAFLFAWALLELSKGVNIFRRLLGLVALVFITIGFFN